MTEEQLEERRRRENYWVPLLESWQSSGLTASEFCRQRGLPKSRFKYWQYQLLPETRKVKPKKSKAPLQESSSALTFVEINPTRDAVSSHIPYPSVSTGIDLVIQDVLRIQLYKNFHESSLTQILRLLKVNL